MIKSKKQTKQFDDELSFVIQKMIGDRPVIRKINDDNWAICNRFSGEAILMGNLPNMVTIGHGGMVQQCA